jgi:hypothetical protein
LVCFSFSTYIDRSYEFYENVYCDLSFFLDCLLFLFLFDWALPFFLSIHRIVEGGSRPNFPKNGDDLSESATTFFFVVSKSLCQMALREAV